MIVISAIFNEIWHHFAWIAGVIILLGIAEYFRPAGHQPTMAARAFNVLVISCVISGLMIVSFSFPLIYDVLAPYGLIGFAFGNWHPTTIPGQVAATLVYMLVWDFFQYWFHRAEHGLPFLWPVHELHHDEEHVNVTTSQRTSVLSGICHSLLVNLPTLIVCGLDMLPLVASFVFFRFYSPFIHANIRLDLGVLTPVIAGPQWHRLHHGRDEQYFNKNFATFFPFIDILFGTYRRPMPGEYPETGVGSRRLAAPHGGVVSRVIGLRPRRDALRGLQANATAKAEHAPGQVSETVAGERILVLSGQSGSPN
jgi:sterol desaturase/sphingolipid hydroxylase (fatty acid hydroxylase superfamily)